MSLCISPMVDLWNFHKGGFAIFSDGGFVGFLKLWICDFSHGAGCPQLWICNFSNLGFVGFHKGFVKKSKGVIWGISPMVDLWKFSNGGCVGFPQWWICDSFPIGGLRDFPNSGFATFLRWGVCGIFHCGSVFSQ